MSDLLALTGTGGSFDVNGKTYQWSPLTLGDRAAFERELRSVLGDRLDMVTPAKIAADDAGLKGDDRKVVLEQAINEHLRLRRMGPFALVSEFSIPDADAILFKHHLLRHHPDITIDEIKAMTNSTVIGAILHMILEQARDALPGKVNIPSSVANSVLPEKMMATGEATINTSGD